MEETARELTIAIAKRAASGGMFDSKLCYELCLDALRAERERCATVVDAAITALATKERTSKETGEYHDAVCFHLWKVAHAIRES